MSTQLRIIQLFQFFCMLLHQLYALQVTVDGANGVGALKVKQLQDYLGDKLLLKPVFDGTDGVLNYQV